MNRQQVAAKHFLMKAYRVDIRINNKLEQIMALNELAKKTSATISDMPGNPNRNLHKMEDIIARVMDMQTDLKSEMLRLVDMKKEVTEAISKVEDPELQTLLELRYLSYCTWEEIAGDLNCGIDNAFKLHRKALDMIQVPV